MEDQLLTRLLEGGAWAVMVFLVWSMKNQNEALIAEMKSRDNQLMDLILQILQNQQRIQPHYPAPPPQVDRYGDDRGE